MIKLEKLKINYSEFCYFFTLTRKEQIAYFFSLYDSIDQKRGDLDVEKLKGFFKMLKDVFFKMLKDVEDNPPLTSKTSKTKDDNEEKIDVMIDDEIIMLESDSLRAIRDVATRFMQFGYILERDKKSEELFKRDKVTRYLRVFKIIDQIQSFSLS
jgi:hypothetical protein